MTVLSNQQISSMLISAQAFVLHCPEYLNCCQDIHGVHFSLFQEL